LRRKGEIVRIVVKRFGKVDDGLSGTILDLIKDCHNHLQPHTVQIVDLYLFQRSHTLNAFLNDEKRRLGIAISPFNASFLATHDAWCGTPRIMVALDKFSGLPSLVQSGAIRHETAHTLLHGSLDYYIFSIPKSLIKLERLKIISRQIVLDILYLVSIAVKDYEATRLLYRRGYVEDQAAYTKHNLEISNEDIEAWNLSKANRVTRLLVLVSLLKTACCAAPLMEDKRYGKAVVEAIARSTSYLPEALSARLLRLFKSATDFGGDTHRNVEMFTNRIILLLDE
jgi:hypothetical protein